MSEISNDTARYLDSILSLLETSFPDETKYSKDYLDWLYLKNPLGATLSANLIREEQVKATYAVLPMELHCHREIARVALSLNTATHPDDRGQGWFPKLANVVYKQAADSGIQAIVGVANENSIRGFIKYLGFERLGSVALRFASAKGHTVQLGSMGAGKGWSKDYWEWRLANPSASYSKILCNGEWLLVAKRKIPVVIGKLTQFEYDLPVSRVLALSPTIPCYVFCKQNYGLDVPRKILPSPWHLIVKNLGMPNSKYADFKEKMVFTGLDSDTF